MNEQLRQLVGQRAGQRCEYCRLPREFDELPFHVDHVISRKQGGLTSADNLALACLNCNAAKGPLTALFRAGMTAPVRLFHPRQDRWSDHFAWSGPRLIGTTEIGAATVDLLGINAPERVAFRYELMKAGLFP